jgi:uncharacterized protein (TIGR04255 family)
MSRPIPKRLQQEPLLEAVWELRFEGDGALPVGEMLPGLLFAELRGEYPHIVRLPTADIPRPIAMNNPAMRYMPTLRLQGADDFPFIVQIGEHVISLNNRRPYAGWPTFSHRIRQLVRLLQSKDIIRKPERYSLKYLDLLELDPSPALTVLNVSLQLGEHDLTQRPVQLRTEIADQPYLHVVQIASPAEVQIPGAQRRSGTLVDIDTVREASPGGDFWDMLDASLDDAHARAKQLFFGLLKPETEQRLGPVYE